MAMAKHSLLAVLLISMVCGLFFVENLQFSTAQTGTQVSGIIGANTAWSKANSPYTLTGPVAIAQDVNLIIEPGTTVFFQGFYIQVNGTLIARGEVNDRINFTSADFTKTLYDANSIKFTQVSNGWNEQTGWGSIIENAYLNGINIHSSVSVKLNNSIINGARTLVVEGSSIVTDNNIGSDVLIGGSVLLADNRITPCGLQAGTIEVTGGSPLISNNTVSGTRCFNGKDLVSLIIRDGSPLISNNIFKGTIKLNTGSPAILNNTIMPPPYITYSIMFPNQVSTQLWFPGICIYGTSDNVLISGNFISGALSGIKTSGTCTVTIQHNTIFNSTENGIDISSASVLTVQNNSIISNKVGIKCSSPLSTITYNNLENNDISFYLDTPNDMYATYNWWGTDNVLEINQTIHDFKNNFNLGKVNFTPFLTLPNPQSALEVNSIALPMPSPTILAPSTTITSPQATPTVPTAILTPTITSAQPTSPSASPSISSPLKPSTSVPSSNPPVSPSAPPETKTMLPLSPEVILGVAVIVVVVVAVTSFLLGKKVGRNNISNL